MGGEEKEKGRRREEMGKGREGERGLRRETAESNVSTPERDRKEIYIYIYIYSHKYTKRIIIVG